MTLSYKASLDRHQARTLYIEFEIHCNTYNLFYDFERLGNIYACKHTHKAFMLFKQLTTQGK